MTFASSASLPASERFFLVQVQPRRFLGTGTSIGGGQYTFAVSSTILVDSVLVNNVTEPTWTHVSGVLTITSATDLSNASNIVTIDHNLFLTGTVIRTTSGVSGVPNAEWQPLITEYPAFQQSMRDLAEGVFSLSNTDIELISTDRWGQSLLGANDSLSKAPVKVWACINDVTTNRKIFDGEVSSVRYEYGKISLSVIDTFNRLKDTATFGTYAQSHVYTGNSGQYPNPFEENSVIPMTIGKSSPFSVAQGWRHLDPFGVPNSATYHLNNGNKAIKVSPQSPGATTPVDFICGRLVGGTVRRLNFGTISAAYEQWLSRQVPRSSNDPSAGSSNLIIYERIIYLQCSTFNCEIGDYIPTVDGWVCGYGAGLWGSYNVAIACADYGSSQNDSGNISPTSGPISVPTIPNFTIPSMSLWIDGGDSVNYQAYYYPLALLPTSTQRIHSSRYLKFNFSGTTLGNVGGRSVVLVSATVDPVANEMTDNSGVNQLVSATVRCRFSTNTAMTHGDAMKFVVSASGLTPNAASFTQADSDLAANVSLTVPLDQASNFNSYLEVSQKIASSTLSVLRVNEAREIEYEVLKNPSALSVDGTRDVINMVAGETSSLVEYQDIVTTLDFENTQLKGVAEIAGGGANATIQLPKAKQLHRVDKSKTISHCLESIQNRKGAIAGYFSSPTVEYNLSTSSEDLASRIGDVIEVTNPAAAGSSENAKGIIVGLNQTGSKTSVKINEIRGVP